MTQRARRMGRSAVLVVLLAVVLAAAPGGQAAPALTKVRAGIVAAIDQLGVPVALDQGLFEKWGLEVTIATPYPTGVDQLNALQAGEIQMGQVGVPIIIRTIRDLRGKRVAVSFGTISHL